MKVTWNGKKPNYHSNGNVSRAACLTFFQGCADSGEAGSGWRSCSTHNHLKTLHGFGLLRQHVNYKAQCSMCPENSLTFAAQLISAQRTDVHLSHRVLHDDQMNSVLNTHAKSTGKADKSTIAMKTSTHLSHRSDPGSRSPNSRTRSGSSPPCTCRCSGTGCSGTASEVLWNRKV